MISSHSIQLLNIITVGQRLVHDKLDEFVRCCFPGEELELEVDGAGPGDDDSDGDLSGEFSN